MVEIYTTKQAIEHANRQFDKWYSLVVLAINARLKDQFDVVSDYIDISDIYEFYAMDEKHRVWVKIVNDFSSNNWDIFPVRVSKFLTFDDKMSTYKWKIAVSNLKH
jgi:hypothetical protein